MRWRFAADFTARACGYDLAFVLAVAFVLSFFTACVLAVLAAVFGAVCAAAFVLAVAFGLAVADALLLALTAALGAACAVVFALACLVSVFAALVALAAVFGCACACLSAAPAGALVFGVAFVPAFALTFALAFGVAFVVVLVLTCGAGALVFLADANSIREADFWVTCLVVRLLFATSFSDCEVFLATVTAGCLAAGLALTVITSGVGAAAITGSSTNGASIESARLAVGGVLTSAGGMLMSFGKEAVLLAACATCVVAVGVVCAICTGESISNGAMAGCGLSIGSFAVKRCGTNGLNVSMGVAAVVATGIASGTVVCVGKGMLSAICSTGATGDVTAAWNGSVVGVTTNSCEKTGAGVAVAAPTTIAFLPVTGSLRLFAFLMAKPIWSMSALLFWLLMAVSVLLNDVLLAPMMPLRSARVASSEVARMIAGCSVNVPPSKLMPPVLVDKPAVSAAYGMSWLELLSVRGTSKVEPDLT